MANYTNQHYVPQGLLKHFSFGKKKKGKIYFCDKNRLKIEKFNTPSIENVACERFMYNYQNSSESLENDFFSEIDTKGAETIDKIIREQGIDLLIKNELVSIFDFVAAQILRVPRSREDMRRLDESLLDLNKNCDSKKNKPKDLQIRFLDDIKKYTKLLGEKLKDKEVKYLQHNCHSRFIISDNPIVTHKNKTFEIDFSLYPKFLSLSEIILLPLSPTAALVFYPKNTKIRNVEKNEDELIDAINFQQILGAERFIFSATENALYRAIKIYSNKTKKMISESSQENANYIKSIEDDLVSIEQPIIKFDTIIGKTLGKK